MKLLLTLLLTFGPLVSRPPQKPAPKKSLTDCVCRCVYDYERDVMRCEITCP